LYPLKHNFFISAKSGASSSVYIPQLAVKIESRALPTGRQVALGLIPIIHDFLKKFAFLVKKSFLYYDEQSYNINF